MLFNTTHLIPLSSKYHIYRGSHGILNIHSLQNILVEDILCIGNKRLIIIEVIDRKKSIIYSKHNFAILRFKTE